mmetsp:Transcript_40434/g.92943  ORF Transcript_40434/g.92943 Transcript_40434/m.92943 type:complete len:219 (-) Transcript_40434:6634-7290(-)
MKSWGFNVQGHTVICSNLSVVQLCWQDAIWPSTCIRPRPAWACRFLHTWLWRWASNVGTLSGIESLRHTPRCVWQPIEAFIDLGSDNVSQSTIDLGKVWELVKLKLQLSSKAGGVVPTADVRDIGAKVLGNVEITLVLPKLNCVSAVRVAVLRLTRDVSSIRCPHGIVKVITPVGVVQVDLGGLIGGIVRCVVPVHVDLTVVELIRHIAPLLMGVGWH